MDVLSDVLGWLRVEGTVSRRTEFTAPWGVSYQPSQLFSFMTVEQGGCVFCPKGHPAIALETGDVVMFSPGTSATLSDQPDTPVRPYAEILEETQVDHQRDELLSRYPALTYGGGGRRCVIRAWGLRFDSFERHPLLSLLPPFIHISNERRADLPWLDTTLRFIRHETQAAGDGSEMMAVRLVDLLFVQVIRAWFEQQPPGEAGWLGALRDKAIRRALTLLHKRPADPWTVEALGRATGMSRSTFSARFGALVGTTPMRYLTQLRMNLAAHALRGDVHLSVAEVAGRVGYDTESSFGRAFKRQFAVSPAAFRRQHAAQGHGRPR